MNHVFVSLEGDTDSTNHNSPYYTGKDDFEDLDDQKECPYCLGQGAIYDDSEDDLVDCKVCRGTGYVDSDFELSTEDLQIDELGDD